VSALALGAIGVAGADPRKPRHAPLKGEGEGLRLVANIPYAGGTDMEFIERGRRDYAIAGDAPLGDGPGAIRIIDITRPSKPRVVSTLKCSLYQADIQISHDEKTLIVAADSIEQGSCLANGKTGFMTIDIRKPTKPRLLGFAEIPDGSHNTTAHPTKPFVYNSDSELGGPGEIQIWSIRKPARPKLVNTVPSVPHSPHDVGFNKKGNLAVTAAISHFDVWDTSNPANPTLIFTGQCPGCSITHDAKFTPNGKGIVIGDEGGGGAPYPCPGGALYFYSWNGSAAILQGAYEPDQFVTTSAGPGGCTSHVFDFDDSGKHISISWYTAGTRYLDVSNYTGLTVGANGNGVTELGWFIPKGGNSWSSKIHEGRWIFSNDINRGFDVYRVRTKGI
jgi:hypothetical protein